jgi:subtilase family serine protease
LTIPLAFGTSRLFAQGQSAIHVPDSSVEHAGERGQKAHTNHVISLRGASPERPGGGSGPSGMTPAKIRTAYNLPSTGGSGIIAIVDAFDYPTALADFNTFSNQFDLNKETSTNALLSSNKVFQVVYASGARPSGNCGWAQESALDIEWAHGMAPSAKIVLVEAASNSFTDLLQAVDVAVGLGASQVSMSWGGSEFVGEDSFDSHFVGPATVTYFAASGDSGGKTIYPGTSPWIVAAGGTTLNLDKNGGFVSEIPGYQNAIPSLASLLNGSRGVPDFSFDANPNTGVAVYDSTRCQSLQGWMVFGGTSVSSPSLAGIVNLADQKLGASELSTIYTTFYNKGAFGSPSFRDITVGSAGTFSAGSQWDFVTGVGSNQGLAGK